MRVKERTGADGVRGPRGGVPPVDVEALDGGALLTLGVADPAELVRRALRNAAAAGELVRSVDALLRAD